ncbi:MAG: DUF3137 domain-containing protein [Bacteroidota bacterium]
MEPPRLAELRIYYNTTIRPELMRTERMRRSLLWRVAISIVLSLLMVSAVVVLKLSFLLLFLIPVAILYVANLLYRFEKFRQKFKPAVVQLLLDFMNVSPNYQSLSYEPKRAIGKDRFDRSGLFQTRMASYGAEDYIKGIVGEMPFEMGEIYVQEESRASHRLQLVFAGIFVHAKFNEVTRGQLAVWPRSAENRMHRSIKAYYARGGRNVDHEIMNPAFLEEFVVYAVEGTVVREILTDPMQSALVAFAREQEDRDLFFAVHDQDLFAAVSHERDLLEPSFFQSNVTFDLIREFYIDITTILKVLSDFDQTH